jgi:hypothetical protein
MEELRERLARSRASGAPGRAERRAETGDISGRQQFPADLSRPDLAPTSTSTASRKGDDPDLIRDLKGITSFPT